MVREISIQKLEKWNKKQLQDRIERLNDEYTKVVWDLETESGIGKDKDKLIWRKEKIEDELEKIELN